MGLWKNIIQKISCKSKCSFNSEDFNQDLLNVDLTKYRLKTNDLILIEKIIRKRPSIHTYKHTRNNLTEI